MISVQARTRGFSFVELLVVVVVLAIIASVVVPLMAEGGTIHASAAARMVMTDITFAQAQAVTLQQPHGIHFQAEGYRVIDADAQVLRSPMHGGVYAIDFTTDHKFGSMRWRNIELKEHDTLWFDATGQPQTYGHIDLEVGAAAYRVAVAPLTGRLSINALP